MSHFSARENLIKRVKRELIGPGSDIFLADPDFIEEVIEGKPLTRYYSGILYPRKKSIFIDEAGENECSDENFTPHEQRDTYTETNNEENEFSDDENDKEISIKNKANQYYPSTVGLTICVPNEINTVTLSINFGTYDKAKYDEIKLLYTSGEDTDIIENYGFSNFVDYNHENRILSLKKNIFQFNKKTEYGDQINDLFKNLRMSENGKWRYHVLTKSLEKILSRKDKYKRKNHSYNIKDFKLLEIRDKKLSEFVECDLPKHLQEGILLHTKLFPFDTHKYFKIVVENRSKRPNGQWFDDKTLILTKEQLNKSSLFQFEIKIQSEKISPYVKDSHNQFLSDEDKNLNFLFRNVKSFAIGHSVATEWDNLDEPKWVKTSYFPQYDAKSQTTNIEDMEDDLLSIRELSTFSKHSREEIFERLKIFSSRYESWINQKTIDNAGNKIGLANLKKCEAMLKRINEGILILSENDSTFFAFQLANDAIYMQMFQTAKYFDLNKGYERYEWHKKFDNMPEYEDYKSLEFPSENIPKWRPFQLAFFLISLKSFTNPESDERDLVDLIWFPTGGGKTEAYLAVAAFLIFYRRLVFPDNYGGVNIIMRYTLRLLTAQQFERASKLVFACEKIRRARANRLGTEEISIGFWVGDKMIRNKGSDAKDQLNETLRQLNQGKKVNNVFQISTCQWCNTKTISKFDENNEKYKFSFREGGTRYSIKAGCNNSNCDYYEGKNGMPIVLVDDDIYKNPPTILFGTVDKFAQIAWKGEARSLFNRQNNNHPPELIIQDELHLLSGPLGSITGLFENVIIELCKDNDLKPKIITSTATIKNVNVQVKALYGRNVSIFPPYGIDIDDSFFAKTSDESTRRYVGILPTGKTATMTQLRLLASLLYARTKINEPDERDNLWTILSYYNSLKDIGKMSNKVNSELKPELEQIHQRMLEYSPHFIRTRELTSRIQSSRIKENLDSLSYGINDNTKENKPLDLAFATNMISVGLDIKRLGVMVINGMPRNIAEYIQSSSRVARKNEGVVFTLLNPDNSRDISVFEHFIPFHTTFYKQVEPLSLTPFTENTFDLLLFTMIVAFYRHKLNQYQNEKAGSMDLVPLKDKFLKSIERHTFLANDQKDALIKKVDDILRRWDNRIKNTQGLKFKTIKIEQTLLRTVENKQNEDDLIAMQSMRNVEPISRIQINQY